MKQMDQIQGSASVGAETTSIADKLDAMLDDALIQTFPASDPIAISIRTANLAASDRPA